MDEIKNINDIGLYDFSLDDLKFDAVTNTYKSNIVYKNKGIKFYTPFLKFIGFDKLSQHARFEFLFNENDFYTFMINFENYIKEKIINEGERMFGHKPVPDTINNLFKSCISLPNKIPSLPLIQFKVNDVNAVSGQEVKLLISPVHIEFHKYSCYIMYDIYDIKATGNNCQLIYYSFSDKEQNEYDELDYIDSDTL